MNGKLRCLSARLAIVAILLAPPVRADWQPDESDRKQAKAASAIAKIRERLPATETYFEHAYGFAIIPSITRVAVGFGAAYGRGIVIEGEKYIGDTSYFQFSSGIQAGAKYFSMIIFFKDAQALADFRNERWQMTGQAGIDLITVGASGTPAFSSGVAIFSVTKVGLMGEFSYSGARFGYKPLPGPAASETIGL